MVIEGNIISKEVMDMEDMFECLDGEKQLEFFGFLLEKLENGEIELHGKPVYPEEIGVDDAYACYATILDMISKF
jgi:hypothetical protein